MGRFFLGLLLGIVATGGGAYYLARESPDCLRRCGEGTACADGRCVAPKVALPAAPPAKAPGRRRARSGPAAAAEAHLAPGDEKPLAQGDALGRPEHIDLTAGGDEGRELTQEDLDRVFKAKDPAIVRCITEAVGDLPLEQGQVEVAFRVEGSGQVSRLRVTAPAVLQRRGLHGCIRGVVLALRFPPSGGASVVTYPFALE